MFDLTLFWVCLCEGYFRPLLPLREKTDRSYVHMEEKKEASDHCLWMMLGRCISVPGLQNEELLCCTVGSVTHTRFLSLLRFTQMLLTNSGWIQCEDAAFEILNIERESFRSHSKHGHRHVKGSNSPIVERNKNLQTQPRICGCFGLLFGHSASFFCGSFTSHFVVVLYLFVVVLCVFIGILFLLLSIRGHFVSLLVCF